MKKKIKSQKEKIKKLKGDTSEVILHEKIGNNSKATNTKSSILVAIPKSYKQYKNDENA